MIVDGKALAAAVLSEVATAIAKDSAHALTLTAITCAPNFETKKYLEMKKRQAAEVGLSLTVVELPHDSTTTQCVDCVKAVSVQSDGVVVQLPLPAQVDKDVVLQAIPKAKDPDGFAYGEKNDRLLPPVVAAIDEISRVHAIEWKQKRVVVLGQGTLVGLPAARYARKRGARVRVYTKYTFDAAALQTADIIVSGIGQPHFITPEHVQDGVVVFDAGTSEDGGELVGDVDPAVATKAALLTPVPGGIGPLTIACLLRNVVLLARPQLLK